MGNDTKKDVPVSKGTEIQKLPPRILSPFEDVERMFSEFFSHGWPRPLHWERPLFPDLAAVELRMPRLDVVDRDEEVVVTDGVLEITLPKIETAKKRSIRVG